MRSTFVEAILRSAALAGASVLFTAGVSSAAAVDVYLQAQSATKTLPGAVTVPMWVFVCDPDLPGDATNENCVPSGLGAPMPRINVAVGDNLTIHLTNTLPALVSILIPGQAGGGEPEIVGGRVQSLTHETAAGETGTYSWNSLRPGTYLYQSGTHPSIQVPMGLYGALVVGPATLTAGSCATGQSAYDNVNSCYDADALLLFSEIDYWQNKRVADAAAASMPLTTACVKLADYLQTPTTGYPCTVDYTPTHFLINGAPYDKATPPPPVGAGAPGDNVLLRLLNAGLRSHTPAIVGLNMGLVAEDGNLYPGLVKQQASTLLPAGKTLDVLVAMPAANATYPLFDRMLDLSNYNQPDGGMLAYLQVGTGSTPTPTTGKAVNDTYTVPEDCGLTPSCSSSWPAPTSVLTNDTGLSNAVLVSGPSNGTLTLLASGSFTYSPNPDFSGADGFTYSASDGTNSYGAQVTLNVSFVNDAPVAANDGPYVNSRPTLTVDAAHGVLGNDSDPEGATLSAVVVTGPSHGSLTLNTNGSFTYNPSGSYTGPDSFTYRATDGPAQSAAATVSLMVNRVANITLNVVDPLGASVTAYRWLVQEDATYHINPAAPLPSGETTSTNFHKSYMPVVAQGCVGIAAPAPPEPDAIGEAPCGAQMLFSELALDPTKHYYVSVLPNDAGTGAGHSIGGAPIPPGSINPPRTVTVIVNNQPIPTAQISVIAFEDISPTNGVPEANEPRLGGFQITLEDAGGRYGMSGGTMSQDAFGNPLKNSLFGTAACPGTAPVGVIVTCPDGTALIKDLSPGKYGVVVTPPAGLSGTWTQTSTIEGTKLQDNWVKAGEPPFLVEFGAPGFHAFIGFVNPAHLVNPGGSNTISGSVTMVHAGRAPSGQAFDSGSYDALGHTRAWVGVNSNAGNGPNIKTVQADPEGNFSIGNIPNGTYQLAIWDEYLDQIISYRVVTVPGGGNVGNIPVPTWFGRHEHTVFLDANEDGIRQPNEAGIPDKVVNLRFRDGTVEQSFPTDTTGFVPFDQVFPYGAWQVAEIDFSRFKPTGVTVTVDGGGDVSSGPYPGLLNPQTGSPRTETGPVLLEGFQSMPGMTSIFEWGKAPYKPGENGGISGIVYYASTRGENDPRLTVGDPWEPGIPSVKVRLYREVATSTGGKTLALVQEVQTDNWDAAASSITGCEGETPGNPFVTQTLGGDRTRCFDGVRNFEQVRPGAVFDGGYAFTGLQPGKYVVEVVPPPGYELYKEEDKNVDFGDSFATIAPVAVMLPGGAMLAAVPDQAMVLSVQGAEPGLAQPPCVGPDHLVPAELSLFPGIGTYAPFAGADRPLCNRKAVILSDQSQAAADFHLFTSTPVAGQFRGLTTDDIAVETNPASPSFGDKWGPAFLPVSMRDFKGQEIYRGYTDAFGIYNGVLPSTFSANIPMPSGYSPAMHMVCLNDPGPLANGQLDPMRNPNYGIFCYTLMYMPGTTTYLDTPLLPNAAFAAGFNSVDCACTDGTPVIAQVRPQTGGPNDFGPWISSTASGASRNLTISSNGATIVPNPAHQGPLAAAPYNQPTITRDFGFGSTQGTVTVGGVLVPIVSWANGQIRVRMPNGTTTGELVVTRGDNGKSSINTVTVTVSNETPIRVPAGGSIQAAIDGAAPGSLILVAPGTYEELVVMWKPVRLQGSGAATIINAIKRPTEKLDAWRTKVKGLIAAGTVDLLPGQPAVFDIVGGGLFGTELGAGVTVLAKNDPTNSTGRSFLSGTNPSRIDGFTITGADGGGGIFVNGYAHNLEIANNYVTSNSGVLHGGVRVGHPFLPLIGNGPFGFNRNLKIHHNAITLNGAQSDTGAGGGVALATGSDGYSVSSNFICGNFNLGDGGGIAHLGLSNYGTIANNQVLFNQTFNQGLNRSGGGILVAGEPSAAVGGLTLGAGNVVVDANLIQGNQAATGHGGGIRTQSVNGRDVQLSTDVLNHWGVRITNNMIVNNVAGWSGAGISLQDTTHGSIVNNTVANNDSTATVGGLIIANASTPQPAGISAERHSLALAGVPGVGLFSNPPLVNNIVWHNRAFHYDATTPTARLLPALTPAAIGQCSAGANYWDLGVLGEPFGSSTRLNPTYSILSTLDYGGSNNLTGNPAFLTQYCNGARTLSTPGPMQVAAEVIEGGNFIDVRYGPLTQAWPATSTPWNYHVGGTTAGLNNGTSSGAPNHDFDNQTRPQGTGVDRGADERGVPGPNMAVTPNSLPFGNVSVNTARTLAVTVVSAGTVNLVLAAPSITNGNVTGRFTFANVNCPIGGSGLTPGASCTLNVTFAPLATGGPQTSTLNVNASNAPSIPLSLTGTGVSPAYTIQPGALTGRNFGNQQVGTLSAPFQFTVTNCAGFNNPAGCLVASAGELWLNGNPTILAPLLGTDFSSQFLAAFRAGDTCTGTTQLAIGASCTFSVVFAPTSVGNKGTGVLLSGGRAAVNVLSGIGNASPVWGTGTRGAVAFTATSLTGTTLSGTTTRTLAFGARTGVVTSTVTINNSGTAPVRYGTATVAGTGFTKGTTDTCQGTTRNPGVTCQISINFNGGGAGTTTPRTGTLSVPTGPAPNTATNDPAVLNLTGN